MTTFTERLHGLADDAPQGGALDEGELWSRGKRLQRRRRVVTASFVAVLVLAIGSLATMVVDVVDRPDLPAADTDAVLGLPDRLYIASPWTAGTDDVGPIGPLVALVGAERRTFWGDETLEVTGVSVAGDYAFLDLESMATTIDVRPDALLSPDGRWVAYLLTGETSDEPYTLDGDPVVGVAVYDTVTGETRRHPVASRHGLDRDDLVWIGDTLLFRYLEYGDAGVERGETTSTSLEGGGVLRWDLVADTSTTAVYQDDPSYFTAVAWGSDVVVKDRLRTFSIVSADGGVTPGPRLSVRSEDPVFVSPDGQRLATQIDDDGPDVYSGGPSVLGVADMNGDAAGVVRRVPQDPSATIIGWRDDSHLAVLPERAETGYVSLDVDTGETSPLVELPMALRLQPQVAAEALQGPLFAAPEPDGPGDPRRIVWLGGGLVLLLAGAGVWRHRARR